MTTRHAPTPSGHAVHHSGHTKMPHDLHRGMRSRLLCVCRLRALVHDALAKHLTDSAAFFADKLVTLSGGAPADMYLLAQACFLWA